MRVAHVACQRASLGVTWYHVDHFQWDKRGQLVVKFDERHKLEFVAPFFNLTNRANLGGNCVTSIRSDSLGNADGYIARSAVIVPKSLAAELAVQHRFSFEEIGTFILWPVRKVPINQQ